MIDINIKAEIHAFSEKEWRCKINDKSGSDFQTKARVQLLNAFTIRQIANLQNSPEKGKLNEFLFELAWAPKKTGFQSFISSLDVAIHDDDAKQGKKIFSPHLIFNDVTYSFEMPLKGINIFNIMFTDIVDYSKKSIFILLWHIISHSKDKDDIISNFQGALTTLTVDDVYRSINSMNQNMYATSIYNGLYNII